MRKIKIVADSSSDIIALEHVSFASAPLKIITKEKEYVEFFIVHVFFFFCDYFERG